MDAQIHLDELLAAWLARGKDEKDIPVHPRDIEIDWVTGEVRLYVAFTREQREVRSTVLGYRDEAIAAIQGSLAATAEDGDDPILELVRDVAGAEVDYLNGLLPSRFRRDRPSDAINDVSKAVLALTQAVREQARRWDRRVGATLKSALLGKASGGR